MADSTTTIANLALQKIGVDRITSIDDDSRPAREIRACYAHVRDRLLRDNRWNFAAKRDQLNALVESPLRFQFAYQLPTDCLRVYQIGDYYPGGTVYDVVHMDAAEWRIEQGKILTNIAAPLLIRYCARIENPVLHDPLFDEALACAIANHVCEILTNSGAKRDLMASELRAAIRSAKQKDAIEDPPDDLPDNVWITARY